MPETPRFDVRLDGELEGSRLLVALASPGMAGYAAGDHLVATHIGTAVARGLPTVTPFAEGTPRHPIRLYRVPDEDLAVLLGEVFFPIGVGEYFVEALAGASTSAVEDITVLHGVPYPHGPDDHAVFRVTTAGYPTERLDDAAVDPLSGGFFDGVVGSLVARSLEGDLPPTGVLVTPAHPPGPDFDGALLLLGAIADQFGLEVDESELRDRSEAVHRQYEELAERMEAATEDAKSDYPVDRMYM